MQVVPVDLEDRTKGSRARLPEAWAGLSGSALDAVLEGVEKGAVFCHKGRWICGHRTEKGIRGMAQLAIQAYQTDSERSATEEMKKEAQQRAAHPRADQKRKEPDPPVEVKAKEADASQLVNVEIEVTAKDKGKKKTKPKKKKSRRMSKAELKKMLAEPSSSSDESDSEED